MGRNRYGEDDCLECVYGPSEYCNQAFQYPNGEWSERREGCMRNPGNFALRDGHVMMGDLFVKKRCRLCENGKKNWCELCLFCKDFGPRTEDHFSEVCP
jgi:hypothetical protein